MAAVKIQHKNCLESTLQKKIINTFFAGLVWSVLGKTVPAASGRTQDLWHSFSQYGPPSRQITYMYVTINFKSANYHKTVSYLPIIHYNVVNRSKRKLMNSIDNSIPSHRSLFNLLNSTNSI